MPYKPKKPCNYAGCSVLTTETYCAEHKKINHSHYDRYIRTPEEKARYGNSWRKIRNSFVKRHPLCEMCLEAGRYVPVEEVHHKIPLSEGGSNSEDNLTALCKSCHSSITAKGWSKK